MAEKDYAKMSQDIIAEVGGKENVSFATHCLTRLRLTVKDTGKVDLDRIKSIQNVLGAQFSGGQLQVIIGKDVDQLYDVFCNDTGLAKQALIDENLDAETNKQPFSLKNALGMTLASFQASVVGILPIISVCGLIKAIAQICGPTMLKLFAEGSDAQTLLTFVGDAGFYFLPVFMGYTSAKSLKTNPFIGMLLGAILIHPTLISVVGGGTPFKVFGLPMTAVNYTSNVLAPFLVVLAMKYILSFFEKVLPKAISGILAPLFTVLIMLPLGLCVFGPIGYYIGVVLTGIFTWLHKYLGPVATGLISGLWYFLVALGMHGPVVMTAIVNFATNGYDDLILVSSCGNFAVYAAAIIALIKIKEKNERETIGSGLLSLYMAGVSEPIIFGLLLKYRKAALYYFIGGFCGGFYAGLTHVKITNFGSNLIPFLSYAGETSNMVNGIISCLICFAVALVLALIFGFDEKKKAEN